MYKKAWCTRVQGCFANLIVLLLFLLFLPFLTFSLPSSSSLLKFAARLLGLFKIFRGLSLVICNSIAVNTKIRENSPDTNPLICVHIYIPAKVSVRERSVINRTSNFISSDLFNTWIGYKLTVHLECGSTCKIAHLNWGQLTLKCEF